MPKRSSVSLLPAAIRDELNRRLMAGGFSGYEALEKWLAEQGWAISKSAIHRHGQKFQSRMEALKIASEQARALADAAGDDEGAMNEAIIRLTQEKTFTFLLDLEGADMKVLPKVGKAVAELVRASVSQKKHMADTREKMRKKFEEIEGDGETMKDPKQLLKKIREEVYGLI